MHDSSSSPSATASAHRVALRASRRIELLALVATIPAFYLELLSMSRWLAAVLYLGATAATLVVLWRESSPLVRQSGWRAAVATHRIGMLLAPALLVSALLPAGEGVLTTGARLVTAALIILRIGESVRPWFWRGGLPHLLVQAVGVMVLCGLGFWWLEPRAHSFGDGLWLAFTTAATVGYGDIVPSTPAAKIFSGFVVLLGVAVLSVVTASIAAKLMQTQERQIEREILHDLHRQMQAIRAELAGLRDGRRAPRRAHEAARAEAPPQGNAPARS